jgi:Zn-dependent protease
VGAHWSVLVLVVLVTDLLGAVVLPVLAPGHAPAAYWLTAAVTALLIVSSLLLHELAHSLVAHRYGLPVQRITLWMMGGVSLLGGEPATPRAAFWIALSGPLTSLGLGVLSGGAAIVLEASGGPDLVVMSVLWLAVMNVFLGVFNLLPGLPLDGGRVLRALLWWRSGDRDRAEITAAKAGHVVGIALGLVGLVELASGQFNGLWLIAIGYVIVISAAAERQAAQVHSVLGTTTVAAVMMPVEVTGYASMSVERFVSTVAPQTRQIVFPVVDLDGRPTGAVSLGRLGRVTPALRASTLLKDVQTPLKNVPVTRPTDLLADLIIKLPPGLDRLALVVEDDHRLVGVVSACDAVRALQLASLRSAGQERASSSRTDR